MVAVLRRDQTPGATEPRVAALLRHRRHRRQLSRKSSTQYAALARTRLQADEFDEFCDTNLGNLDDVLHEFFGSDMARDAVRQKVVAMYPEHEVDEFTDLFWERIQNWRNDQ